MGKRSGGHERRERQYWPTPYEAVTPLLAHLGTGLRFVEPCAGDGRLIRHLERHGHQCVYACDLEPQSEGIITRDILMGVDEGVPECDAIITNTPWERQVLHAMLDRFLTWAPVTWVLLDADYGHIKEAIPYGEYCHKMVSVGRVSWLGNGKGGMENAAWLCFKPTKGITQFVWRT